MNVSIRAHLTYTEANLTLTVTQGFHRDHLLPTERGHLTHGDGTGPPSGSFLQASKPGFG